MMGLLLPLFARKKLNFLSPASESISLLILLRRLNFRLPLDLLDLVERS
jgi:hypothetical protein